MLGALSTLFFFGITNRSLISFSSTANLPSISYLWSLGFGTVTPQQLLAIRFSGINGLIATILIANAPQLLVSTAYLMYNNLFTSMLLAREWNKFGTQRRTLRVTTPRGQQRSTYWLQLPYSYAIPILIASSLLHWLVSQSIFLAKVNVYDSNDQILPDASVTTCGYSCIAILFILIIAVVCIIGGNANGFRKYEPGMPLAGSCSAAISAACHAPEGDEMASTRPVMWGVVGGADDVDNNGVGHCSFSSLGVSRLVPGRLYA